MSLFPNYDITEQTYIEYINTFPKDKVQAITNFIDRLSQYHSPLVFNPWGDVDESLDTSCEADEVRRKNLLAYLLPRLGRARVFVVAEAVGYQGGRFSGIAITCERMLLGLHPTIKSSHVSEISLERTSSSTSELLKKTQQTKGFNEPTDTVVWGAIVEHGINPYDTLLWNIFPFHPFKEGNPLSNRTPTEQEQQLGWDYTKELLDLHEQFSGAKPLVLAVGQKSADTMHRFDLEAIGLRHPANGGANLYRVQFAEAIRNARLFC